MGWIGRADLKIMQISKDIAELGAFQIRVFPDEPVWSRLNSDKGVRTKELTVPEGKALNVWLEANLSDSMLEVVQS